MLVTALGDPVPPQSVVKRLAAVDERLTIKWVPSLAGDYWGIVERWKSDDPRWQQVHEGQITRDQAFDLRAMLPSDCSAEQAEGFVQRFFERVTHAPTQAAEAVQKIAKHNAAAKTKHVEQFLIEQEEKHVRTTKHELEVSLGVAAAHPISHGIGDSPRAQRRKNARTAEGEAA